jgi:hypothetical protein
MQNFIDRRAHPRQDLLVSVRPPAETSSERWHTTRDVSAGGMRLLSDRPLVKGDRLPLEMLLPDGSWLAVTTKVAWSVKLDIGSSAEYEVGLRFLELTEDDLDRLQLLLPTPPNAVADGGVREN